jgi:glycosyltransferase involved in cell wall biosynthesis
VPTPRTYPEEIINLASQTLRENRVAIFIVCYNAEKHIETVLGRIPDWVSKKLTEVFIIDDSSKDATVQKAVAANWTWANAPLRVFKTLYKEKSALSTTLNDQLSTINPIGLAWHSAFPFHFFLKSLK